MDDGPLRRSQSHVLAGPATAPFPDHSVDEHALVEHDRAPIAEHARRSRAQWWTCYMRAILPAEGNSLLMMSTTISDGSCQRGAAPGPLSQALGSLDSRGRRLAACHRAGETERLELARSGELS